MAYPTLPALAVKVAPIRHVAGSRCQPSVQIVPLSCRSKSFPGDKTMRGCDPESCPFSPGFQRASESFDPELHEDLAFTRVYYCRASINLSLMDLPGITREGVAISSGVVSVRRRETTSEDHRQILSR